MQHISFIDHRSKDRCYAIEIKLANNTNDRDNLELIVSRYTATPEGTATPV